PKGIGAEVNDLLAGVVLPRPYGAAAGAVPDDGRCAGAGAAIQRARVAADLVAAAVAATDEAGRTGVGGALAALGELVAHDRLGRGGPVIEAVERVADQPVAAGEPGPNLRAQRRLHPGVGVDRVDVADLGGRPPVVSRL